MPTLKPIEILLIVLVVLLLFGAKRLPDLAKSVGTSLKILKTEVKDTSVDEHATPAAGPASGSQARTQSAGGSDDRSRPERR